jgi:hypothetical protein
MFSGSTSVIDDHRDEPPDVESGVDKLWVVPQRLLNP